MSKPKQGSLMLFHRPGLSDKLIYHAGVKLGRERYTGEVGASPSYRARDTANAAYSDPRHITGVKDARRFDPASGRGDVNQVRRTSDITTRADSACKPNREPRCNTTFFHQVPFHARRT